MIAVQGSKKEPKDIDKSIEDVIKLGRKKVEKCTDETFQTAISSIKTELFRKADNLTERSSRIWKEIAWNTYDFNRKKD